MRIVFMGTPAFAATVLKALLPKHQVVAVYTRPDAVRGRGRELVPSPVKAVAVKAGVPVLTPKTLKDPQEQQRLADLKPDVVVVAAYGMILPKAVLDTPAHGCVNVHASLLPRWRGAAPIERAILAGDDKTGVCVMRMEEGLDTGAVCARASLPIGKADIAQITDRLARLGADALLEALPKIADGTAEWEEQEGAALYAPKVGKHELDLWSGDSPEKAWCKVRAATDGHPCKAVLAGRDVRVEAADIPSLRDVIGMSVTPRQMLLWHKRLFIGFSSGPMEVLRVRPDGKRSMSAVDFAAGVPGVKGQGVRWEPTKAAKEDQEAYLASKSLDPAMPMGAPNAAPTDKRAEEVTAPGASQAQKGAGEGRR